MGMFRPIVSIAAVSSLHFSFLTTATSWRKRRTGEKASAVNNYLCSFCVFVRRPFRDLCTHSFRAACGNMLCVKNMVLGGGSLSQCPPAWFWLTTFVLLISLSSHPFPPPLYSPLIFSQAELSLSVCMNTVEFH